MEILPVGEEHLPALAELAGVIWRRHYPGIISHGQIDYMLGKMYSLETLREEIRSQGIRFYRLVVGGQMAGFASIGPLETPEVWKLHKLYLLPELHRRGLGSRLLQHCEAEARRLGARRIAARSQQTQPAPHRGLSAQRVYGDSIRRDGFRERVCDERFHHGERAQCRCGMTLPA